MGQRQGMGNGQQGNGQGANFVDENKDGVCDHFVDADGDGQQHGPRGGMGQDMGARGGRGMHSMGHGMRGGMGRGAQN